MWRQEHMTTAAKEWCFQLVCVQLMGASCSFLRELYMKIAVVLECGIWREAVMHLPWLLGNTDVLQMCVVALMFGFYFYHWLIYRQKVFGESKYLILKPVAECSQLLLQVHQSQWETDSGKAVISSWEGMWTFHFIHFAFSLDEPCLKIRMCTSL